MRAVEWARQQFGGYDVVSEAEVDPELLADNLVVVTSDPAKAREAALAFERVRVDHAEVGSVVLGRRERPQRVDRVDAQRVTVDAARKAAIGGAIGAIVGALVIATAIWAIVGGSTAVAAAAIGGALFGAFVGAVWSYVIGTGESAAYRESFVDPDAADLIAVSIHSDHSSTIDKAVAAVADLAAADRYRVDRAGVARAI